MKLFKFSLYTVILFIVSSMFVSCDDSDKEPTITNSVDGVVINGVRWATCNVAAPGQFATNPEDAGMFYQWDDTIGWSSINTNKGPLTINEILYEDVNYTLGFYRNSSLVDTAWIDIVPPGSVTSWNDTYKDTHISTDTISGDTVQWASINNICPDGWRLPTKEEIQSLINSGYNWTTVNGVYGCIFGSDNNAIFLPAVGYRSSFDGSLLNSASGYYWTKDQVGGVNPHLFIQKGGVSLGNKQLKLGDALSIRCVKIQ